MFDSSRIDNGAGGAGLRPARLVSPFGTTRAGRRGFTLVELLVAMVVTLLLMGFVAQIFEYVSESIAGSRAAVEITARLRTARDRLQADLSGATARMLPPLSPDDGLGYFEIIEGPIGPVVEPRGALLPSAIDADGILLYDLDRDGAIDANGADYDTTVGDNDDLLMLTTRSQGRPFSGLYAGTTAVESNVAEVSWFVRGTTLYRRVLLVRPDLPASANLALPPTANFGSVTNFYGQYDISARQEGGANDRSVAASAGTATLVANSLGDLTKRENRYGHQPWAFPHDARFWGELGLPTLRECSFVSNTSTTAPGDGVWPFPLYPLTPAPAAGYVPSYLQSALYADGYSQLLVPSGPAVVAIGTGVDAAAAMQKLGLTTVAGQEFDAHTRPFPWQQTLPLAGDVESGTLNVYSGDPNTADATRYYSTRYSEDIMLANVLSFDVKVWDPGAPIVSYTNATANPADDTIYAPGDTSFIGDTAAASYSGYLSALSQTVPVNTNYIVSGVGAYVDLNYMCLLGTYTPLPPNPLPPVYRQEPDYQYWVLGLPKPYFHGAGDWRSRLRGTNPFFKDFADRTSFPLATALRPAVYDTWSTHYERDGFDQDGDGVVDEGTDGVDNYSSNIATGDPYTQTAALATSAFTVAGVDDVYEQEAPPPYSHPLRGVQIKIRAVEPSSRQIIEFTVMQEFLPE